MVIGKPQKTSISKAELFTKYNETQVLCAAFPEITSIPCKINSPFRFDKNPSFSIFMDDDSHIRFKDFGDSNCKGSLLDLLCMKWKCSFNQVFDKILEMMEKENPGQGDSPVLRPKNIRIFSRKESSEMTKIEVVIRPWRPYDYKYWRSYGVDPHILKRVEVYPIAYKIVTIKTSNEGSSLTERKYTFPADKYAYVFVERKEGKLSLKIYQPFNQKGFKWCSKMDASVISLWTRVPEYGDTLIITSSTKDACCIYCNLNIPAIAPQGEGYNISDTAVSELKRRYKQVYISYDGDKAGYEDAEKLSKNTGFPIIQCPSLDTPDTDREEVKNLIKEGLEKKGMAKDWSDIFLYFGKERFIEEFNKAFEKTLTLMQHYGRK